MSQHFFIPMKTPTITFQKKRLGTRKNGKAYIYSDDSVREVKASLLSRLAPFVPERPYSGAVLLLVKWLFPLKGNHRDGEYKISKPDTDNLEKLLKDIMTELDFWKDDAQVCSEHIEKFWAANSGIFIQIEEINNGA
ncbi:MAG: RusA family crossover junction endodeoxyribonuclease [Ruminococcus sp.]|nr:RusA family crossover junction endodeoxyribonuclease [Ruminococcus sp.]